MVQLVAPKRVPIPELLENWPFESRRNPTYNEAFAEDSLKFFFNLPEVRQSARYQAHIRKICVRKYSVHIFRVIYLELTTLLPLIALLSSLAFPHHTEG